VCVSRRLRAQSPTLLRDFLFPWTDVADGKWHINSHYPTQAPRRAGAGKARLEWGTQHLLPVWPKLWWASPDFLWRLLALANFMRLSLMKAAHVNLFGAMCRKSGLPVFFGPRTLVRTWGTRPVPWPPFPNRVSGRFLGGRTAEAQTPR
jgi:hypothetical protein